MSATGPDGQKVRAYLPAPKGGLDEVFPDITPAQAGSMGREADSIHAAAARIRSRAGTWRTRDGLEQVLRDLDNLESAARRLRAILP